MQERRTTAEYGFIVKQAAARGMNVIAVTSGKGGVGKTNIAVNLAVSMAKSGKRVVLFDADLSLANVDIALGLKPKYDIRHVVSGEKTLKDILLEGPHGLRIVPASSGVAHLSHLTEHQRASIVGAFSELHETMDTLVVDTAAGIHNSVQTFCSACQSIVVVLCDEPSSITDAYALIKVLNRECGVKDFQLLANMVDSDAQGRQLYGKLSRVASRFLNVSLGYLGAVPRDNYLRKAVQQQAAVVDVYPRCVSSKALGRVAQKLSTSNTVAPDTSRQSFFMEQLIHQDRFEMGAV